MSQIEGGWRLALAALEARAMEESLRLAAPTQVTLGGDGGVELAPLALQIGRGGQLRASGRWGPERADITATLTALPLAIAERLAPDVKPRGTLAAELRATGPVAKPELRLTLNGEGSAPAPIGHRACLPSGCAPRPISTAPPSPPAPSWRPGRPAP
ncbi:hypothetical protein ACFQU2_01475 [Siccirubricoccus deserti]